jgi:hypothetical protein
MQDIFGQVIELPRRDTIVTELVETEVCIRWPCHVCGGHTDKVRILCEGKDPRDGETVRVYVSDVSTPKI